MVKLRKSAGSSEAIEKNNNSITWV